MDASDKLRPVRAHISGQASLGEGEIEHAHRVNHLRDGFRERSDDTG